MKARSGILSSFALLALASALTAQSFLVRTFEEQDGLLNSAVNDIAQDSSGRMWFTARNGISVYDGAKWTAFNTANGLPTTTVQKILVDDGGVVWAIGENPSPQLLRFGGGNRWESFALPAGRGPSHRVTALAARSEAGSARVAVGTDGSGVFLFDGSRWTEISKSQGLAGDRVIGLEVFEDGFVAATEGGLSFLGKASVESRWAESDPRLQGDIRGLAVEKTPAGEKIWIAGPDWLGTWEGKRFSLLSRENPARFNVLFPTAVLLPDNQGGLFIGNAQGVFFFNGPDGFFYPLGILSGLIAEGATSLFLDREKNVWIAGLRGVSRISSRRFYNFRKVHGLLEDEVTAILSLKERGLAFGHNTGLTIWDGTKFDHVVFKRTAENPGLQSRVLDMAVDKDGGLWIAASERGLGRWSRESGLRWIDFPGRPAGMVTSVVIDQNQRIWVSGYASLYQIQNGRPVPVFQDVFHDIFIRKLAAEPDGSIYAASASFGVFRWDGKDWRQSSGEADPGISNVFAVHLDSRGRTLIGTFSGLYTISNDRLVRFVENGFEINRPVYLILEDKPGRLWFGTDNGVIRWDGKTRRSFSKAEGLSGREVNRSAGIVDRRGRIWIGTNAGVSSYREEYDFGPDITPPPLISITGLDVNGQSVPFSEEISLGYRENNLVFHFVGTSFLDESALRFQSRLDGFDDSWSPEYAAADRQIRYTNLPPGSYVFNLRARNAVGTISARVSSPVIRVRNPFWLHWWFIAVVLLVGGGLIVSLGLAVTQHRQAERLEALVAERTFQIQAALNEKEILLKEIHHRVKNNLQIISSLLFLQSRKIKEPGTLGLFQASIGRIRAMALVHESLYRSDQLTSIGMEDYLRKLVNHLIETYSLQKEAVAAEVQASGVSLPLETAITFGLIVNELISNALKHAFPDNRRGVVRINLERAAPDEASGEDGNPKIVLTVQDNGVGIPEEMESGKTDSLGLRLVQNLVSQLDGTVDIRREGGTVFRIVFPG